MSLLKKFLTDAQLTREITDIDRDRLATETLRGRVAAVSDEIVQIERYSDGGEFDGVSVIRLADVTRVRKGGSELSLAGRIADQGIRKPSHKTLEAKSLWEAVEEIQRAAGYVVLYAEALDDDMLFIGRIAEQDDNFVQLAAFGTLTSQDTYDIIIDKDDVTRVDFDARYEAAIVKFIEVR